MNFEKTVLRFASCLTTHSLEEPYTSTMLINLIPWYFQPCFCG
ncbi:hypothetical protein MC7420_4429 [Coleofasciculus chthonoplastes PCC 7420]|uniref:Uncharacterized protein n=1 Tax=Coleofasciculus chthonoplastes PCC 7420 TaxID=118168 RepID=B4VXU7_9CYAN|nr:hypothetical protein MC7420_4429 [Coleofasciculus chthonoplastes PCC 7420]